MFFKKSDNEKTENKIELVKLKNGSEVPKPIVYITMMNLKLLMNTNPIAFYELVKKCKDPTHKMLSNAQEAAAKLALIDWNGSIHSSTRDIVLSAVWGEGFNMILTSPVAPQHSFTNRM